MRRVRESLEDLLGYQHANVNYHLQLLWQSLTNTIRPLMDPQLLGHLSSSRIYQLGTSWLLCNEVREIVRFLVLRVVILI